MLDLTTEQLRGLAALERAMDNGTQSFVLHHGERLSVQPEVMEKLELVQGQTINSSLFVAILSEHLAQTHAKLCQKATPSDFERL